MSGGNNILDKNAMEQIAEIAIALPGMRLEITREIQGVKEEVHIVSQRVTAVEGKIDAIGSEMETEPLRCKYRETIDSSNRAVGRLDTSLKDVENEQVAQGKDLEAVKTRINILGGLNAAYTTIATIMAKGLGSFLQGGS